MVQVAIRSCARVNLDQEPIFQRFLASVRSAARAKELVAQYQGVIIEVTEQQRTSLACGKVPSSAFDAAGFVLGEGRYFVATRAADACTKRFVTGQVLKLSAHVSCCDGDPNVPCLLTRD